VDYGDFEEVDKEKAEDSLLRAERFLKKAVSLQKSLIDQL
jgi:uncharacterized protein (UPF0332 family)